MTEKTISDLASEWGLQSIETARRRARRMGLPTRRDPIDRRRLLVAADACQFVDKKEPAND